MTLNQFSVAVLIVGLASFLAGISAGFYFGSALAAVAAAFLLPAAILLFFGGAVERGWWSANQGEAQKSNFRSEAAQSLGFVVWITLALSLVAGITAYFENSIYEGTFAGMMLAMTLFGYTRKRDVAARKLS